MPFSRRTAFSWQLRSRALSLGTTTVVMGVLNVTPDSFSDGGAFKDTEAAIAKALQMLDDGAGIVDIGGESTRPGKHEVVSAQQEIDRVVPVIEGILRLRPGAILSADTYKSETARAAVRAGAEIVNDVSGFLWDPSLAAACAELDCGVILMHTRGRPDEWRSLPRLADDEIVPMVVSELRVRLETAIRAGVSADNIVLDPGFGFGKAFSSNYPLLANLSELRRLGQPLLAGVSRKSFLGRTLAPLHTGADAPMNQRGNATVAATAAAILAGADLVRVHDVKPSVEAALICDAILAAQ